MDFIRKGIRRALKYPGILFFLQAAGFLLFLKSSSRWTLTQHRDSPSYLDLAHAPLLELLTNYRTPGYPLFLKFIQALPGDLIWIPVFQLLIHLACVWIFYRGLICAGLGRTLSFLSSSLLIYSPIFSSYGSHILTDSLGSSFAIATIGSLFIALKTKTKTHLFLLSFLTFSTCLIRPVYLFLLPLIAMVTVAQERTKSWKAISITLFPFLAYGILRFLIIGQFGFVSFTGQNISGIALQFLNQDTLSALKKEHQDIGRSMIERREKIGELARSGKPIPKHTRLREAILCANSISEKNYRYPLMQACYAHTISRVGRDTLYKLTQDNILVDRILLKMSLDLISSHFYLYLRWLKDSLWSSFQRLASANFVLLFLFILLALEVFSNFLSTQQKGSLSFSGDPPSQLKALNTFGMIVLLFFLGKTMVVCLVEPPLPRYIHAATLLFPSFILAVIGNKVRRIRSNFLSQAPLPNA